MSDNSGLDNIFRRRLDKPNDVFRYYFNILIESINGVASVKEGFNSSLSYIIRVLNYLRAF